MATGDEPTAEIDLDHLEQARSRADSVRPKSMQRVLLADAVVCAAVRDDVESEVWDEFIEEWEGDELLAGVGDFIAAPADGGYVGVGRFRRLLLDDVGPEVIGEETAAEWFDKNDGTLRDVLHVLRHFHSDVA